jgi:hypothetical protein
MVAEGQIVIASSTSLIIDFGKLETIVMKRAISRQHGVRVFIQIITGFSLSSQWQKPPHCGFERRTQEEWCRAHVANPDLVIFLGARLASQHQSTVRFSASHSD